MWGSEGEGGRCGEVKERKGGREVWGSEGEGGVGKLRRGREVWGSEGEGGRCGEVKERKGGREVWGSEGEEGREGGRCGEVKGREGGMHVGSILTFTPAFSARALGIASKLSANFFMAYCSKPGHVYIQGRGHSHTHTHITHTQSLGLV